MAKKAVLQKVEPFVVAQARKQFIADNIQYLYTRECESAARNVVRQLANKHQFEYVRTEALLENMIANVLERKFKYIARAETLGYTNAMGYDVVDMAEHIYIEAKDYQISARGGVQSPKLSAMVSGLRNKFCTVVALVTDPYLLDGSKYQLYLIPQDAIPSDDSDALDIAHHKITRTDKDDIYEQLENLGGASFAKYRIQSLNDLYSHETRLRTINIKKLARVLRELEASCSTTASQDEEFKHLLDLFKYCIVTANKKIKVPKNRYSTDYKAVQYDIGGERIFFDGSSIYTRNNEVPRE